MTRTLYNLAILAVILAACKKDTGIGRCENVPNKTIYQVYFKGYETADVDTIIVRCFAHDGSFSSVVSMDTIFSIRARKSGDVIIRDSTSQHDSPFLTCNNRWDYEVEPPAVSRTYRIWDINYGADTAATHYDAPCPKGAVGMAYPSVAQVNGPHEIEGHQWGPSLYLKK